MNNISKYLLSSLLAFSSSSIFAESCLNLLGPVQGPLPNGVFSATVTYADNRIPDYTAGPNFEMPTGSPTPNCFVIVNIDTDASLPNVIKLDLVLPPSASWNGKFYMAGQGGFAGARNAMNRSSGARLATLPLDRGYAISTTDTGHSPTNPGGSWALLDVPGINNEPEINWSHTGVHLATVIGKKLTEQFYGSHIQRAYFSGFSNGGRQAVMEAARYPDDYDGIIAGAPAQNITGIAASFAKITQHQFPDPNAFVPLLQTAQYNLISQRVLAVCDGIDGIVDGMVRDPRACQFNIDTDIPSCPGNVPDPSCLTVEQKKVVEAVTQPLYLSKSVSDQKREISRLPGEWNSWIGNLNVEGGMYFFGREIIRYFIEENATTNVQGYPLLAKQYSLLNDSDVPRNVKKYLKQKGKLIIYHGWDDAALSPRETISFYEEITHGLGKKERDSTRLFMLPAFGHAVHRYSSGLASFDFLTALENWVEYGIAPDSVKSTDDTGTIIRPWCKYPKVAVRINPSLPDPNYDNYKCDNPH